jgi:GT2 family glycosyltransferase
VAPDLAIGIPTHNRTDLLAACLASVVRWAPSGTEIIVVDDASPNRAASWVAGQFAGVRWVRLPRRGGFCVAVNTGLRATACPIVELLNDDTEVTAGWAEAALALFKDPKVGAVAPLVLNPPAEGSPVPRIDSAGDRYYLGGVAGKRFHGRRLDTVAPCRQRVFGASASSAFYRRDAVLQVGGFPEEFAAYFEDIDLAFRLRRAGYEIVFEPAARVWHHGTSSYQANPRLLAQQSRNEEMVFWRNLPGPLLARALLPHLAVVVVKAWRRWHEGRLRPFLFGRLRVVSEIPAVLRYRRKLWAMGPPASAQEWGIEKRFWFG